jgi:hypothetical protein
MATTSSDSVWTLGTTKIVIPPGATQAVLISPFAGQLSVTLKYSSGGTLEVLPAGLTTLGSPGCFLPIAQAAATLAALSGMGYLLGGSEVLSISGPASFYLSSLNATSIVYAIFTKGQGY